jgi:hypothetical protein
MIRAERDLPETGWGREEGGEMTQAMYAYVNK